MISLTQTRQRFLSYMDDAIFASVPAYISCHRETVLGLNGEGQQRMVEQGLYNLGTVVWEDRFGTPSGLPMLPSSSSVKRGTNLSLGSRLGLRAGLWELLATGNLSWMGEGGGASTRSGARGGGGFSGFAGK